MNLYVWEGVLCDYTCGMVCVLAENEDEAWALLKANFDTEYRLLTGELREAEKISPRLVTAPEAFVMWGSA